MYFKQTSYCISKSNPTYSLAISPSENDVKVEIICTVIISWHHHKPLILVDCKIVETVVV